MSRRLVYLSAPVLLFAGLAALIAASAEWSDRASMVSPLPAEAAEQAWFVLDLYAIAALNLASCLAVIFLRRRITWWLIAALQAALFVWAIGEGMFTDPAGWFLFSVLPLLTGLLLVGLRRSDTSLRTGMHAH